MYGSVLTRMFISTLLLNRTMKAYITVLPLRSSTKHVYSVVRISGFTYRFSYRTIENCANRLGYVMQGLYVITSIYAAPYQSVFGITEASNSHRLSQSVSRIEIRSISENYTPPYIIGLPFPRGQRSITRKDREH